MRDDGEIVLPAEAARRLLAIARASVEHGVRHGSPLPVDLDALPAPLAEPAASFVTLRGPDGELRGCVGELEASRALAEGVAHNAWRAASRDPRFAPVAAEELDGLEVHVSVLGPLEPLAVDSEAALRDALRPGRDGLLLDDGVHRATFLPAVWASLPEPARFLGELARKAGLRAGVWPAAMRAWRYGALELSEPGR